MAAVINIGGRGLNGIEACRRNQRCKTKLSFDKPFFTFTVV